MSYARIGTGTRPCKARRTKGVVQVKHFGDITKLSGYDLPPVDVVIGGSPCQDLSVAGKGAGLAGNRSGLFMEQLRIVKELRNEDRKRGRTDVLVRPRFMVWENVPGAFSSNGGRDFQIVLQETIRIAEPDAPDIPCPKRWPLADAYFGDGWSVAYRVLDAQFWGVPQRRRRICLVADFGGRAAAEILFVRESLSGDITSGGTPGKDVAGCVGSGAYPAIARNLTAEHEHDASSCHAVFAAGFSYGQGGKARSIGWKEEMSPTLRSGSGGDETPCVYDARGNGDGKTVNTLTGDHGNRVTDYTPIVARRLTANQHKHKNREDAETYLSTGGIVRRLTPLEAERLQGFPDGWTDIGDYTDDKGRKRKTSDSARYRALGNSIALPPWRWVLSRIAAQYDGAATLGSLFDGIGGFPYLWEQINGKGTAVWASEVDAFCIAVTKARIG